MRTEQKAQGANTHYGAEAGIPRTTEQAQLGRMRLPEVLCASLPLALFSAVNQFPKDTFSPGTLVHWFNIGQRSSEAQKTEGHRATCDWL